MWRKAYPIGLPNRPPNAITATKLGENGVLYDTTLDLNKTVRHRDLYRILGDIAPSSATSFGEYDEGLITFNNETFKSFSYNITFSADPIAVFTVNSSTIAGQDNVNIYGLSRNTTGGIVALSAPFTGTIRYRAVYSPSYPEYFMGVGASIAPTNGIFKATATGGVPDNVSYKTFTWSALSSVPSAVYTTPYDDFGNYDADVALAISAGTLTAAGALVEISAPISSSIYVLAIE